MITYCVGCGTQTESAPRSIRLYCSKQCDQLVNRYGVPPVVRDLRACIECGKMFAPSTKTNQTYCSRRCVQTNESKLKGERRAGTSVGPRPCTSCGVEFLPNRRGAVQKYCTVECRTTFLLARDRERRGKPTPAARDCLVCGKTFIPGCDTFRGVKVETCSRNCHTRVDVNIRRARKHTDRVERIYPMVVMNRDNWTCGICGDAIDPAATFPSSRYRSIDHIIPLTRGGSHLYSNVQAAHFGCNVAKGKEQAASYMTG